jgi:DNA primase
MILIDKLPSVEDYYASQRIVLLGHSIDEWKWAKCCFHFDSKRTMRVSVKKGEYRCFICGSSGKDFIEFHQKRYDLDFIDAVKSLGAWGESA